MNTTTIKDYEVMAPVGSRESLQAAIQAGADSIYFGVEQLNMRSHSANHFTIDDLREIAATCAEHGMKSYLTVNTIIYDEDVELMHHIIDAAYEAKISAVIASDVAVMTYCRKKGVEVHLSHSSISATPRHWSSTLSLPTWWCLRVSLTWIRWLTSTLRFRSETSSDQTATPSASRCSATAPSVWLSAASAI